MTTIVAVTDKDLYRASIISSRVKNDFVAGLQTAKLNELKNRMRKEVVKFAYLKKDLSVRIAYGTLMPQLMSDKILGTGICGDARKVVVYYDVECGNFRCFQMQALIKIW
jgi:hypothetical protein